MSVVDNQRTFLSDNPAIQPLCKENLKMTVLAPGGGAMFGNDVCAPIVSRGVAPHNGDVVPCYSEPRKRKIYSLKGHLARPVIILKGHHDRKFFECQLSSFILNGRGGRFFDHLNEGAEAMADWIARHTLIHTIKPVCDLVFLSPGDDADARPSIPFTNILLKALPPAFVLEGVSAPAPPRKTLFTPQMLDELRAGNDTKVLQKVFSPAGSATWLLCRIEEDNDTLWGCCDIGAGYVEYGPVSLKELETSKSMTLHLERDKFFRGCDYTVCELIAMTSLPSVLQK